MLSNPPYNLNHYLRYQLSFALPSLRCTRTLNTHRVIPAMAKANGLKHLSSYANQSPITYASRLTEGRALAEDVWSIFNAANLPQNCINLGQGYMNFAPPSWARQAANDALATVAGNHYAHPKGSKNLRNALKEHYGPAFNRDLDVETEILVTSGANEGQYSVFVAFINPGEEVIMFEPYFDQYLDSIVFSGGKPVYVPLHPPTISGRKVDSDEWKIDFNELRRAITPKTKMIIINTPHNPVGKVFTKAELESIAALAIEFNLIVMSDEVYDCIVFDNKEHIRFANLPGMWERTISVYSAGKAFAATGWRVGYLIGPSHLIQPSLAACRRIVFSSNSPMQEAVATSLTIASKNNFFEIQRQEYQERREVLLAAFDKIGLKYTIPGGSYFALLDISSVTWPQNYPFPETLEGRGRDFKACWYIACEAGVSSIPVSEFYCDEHRNIGENYARFAFCKDVETLKLAGERLQKIKNFIANGTK